jgi:hypothetical protein
MFSGKSITKMPTPTFSLYFSKVAIGILVIDFQGNVFMSPNRFQNKFLFNLRRHLTLYDLPFQSYDQSKMNKNRNSVTELRGQAALLYCLIITPICNSIVTETQ